MSVIRLSRLVHTIQHSIIGVSLHMFLKVLRAFEGLATKLASVGLQGYVDPDVRRNVIAFDHLNMAVGPCTLQVEIVGALAPDVLIAYMVLDKSQRNSHRATMKILT